MSFGLGIHFCIAAQLARLEIEIALRALAGHLVTARIDPDGVRWRPSIVQRGPATLPVTLRPAASPVR